MLSDYSTDTETEALRLLCQPTGQKCKTPVSTTLTSSFIEIKTSLFGVGAIESESDVTYSQVWWPILGIRALYLPIQVHTHPPVNTHTHREHTPRAVDSHLCCGTRGAVGGSVPCSRAPRRGIEDGESAVHSLPPHLQSLPARDSNSQHFIMSPTLYL